MDLKAGEIVLAVTLEGEPVIDPASDQSTGENLEMEMPLAMELMMPQLWHRQI